MNSTMNSTLCLNRPVRNFTLNSSKNPKFIEAKKFKLQLPSHLIESSKLKFFENVNSMAGVRVPQQLRDDPGESSRILSRRIRVSSNDAQFSSLPNKGGAESTSFAEFITSERVKVVAMLALALALCNADRVVMSVAIVPLSLAHGWSRSFSGIVQVAL